MPADETIARRVIGQVMSAISAITALYQNRTDRERDREGRLIATVGDYAVARRLLMEPLHQSLGLGDCWKMPNRYQAEAAPAVRQQSGVGRWRVHQQITGTTAAD